MICVITTPIDLGKYVEVWNLKQRFPHERVCHISWADLSQMQPNETLYLVAHGNTTHVEGFTPTTLAARLIQCGLAVAPKKIKLLSCSSGIRGLHTPPLCQQLADQIAAQQGPRTLVVGFNGFFAATDQTGRTFAQDVAQADYPDWPEFEHLYGTQYAQLNLAAKQLPYNDEHTILANAALLQGQTTQMFNWLYQHNEPFNERTSAIGKTYGVAG